MTEEVRKPASFAFVAVLASVLAGCERGCLWTWLAEHDPAGPRPATPSFGGTGPRGSRGPDASAASVDLGGTDCSDGLARCSGGLVEVSVAGHVSHPCAAPKELPGACACPWRSVGPCTGACVKDGVEVAVAPDAAREQLCAAPEPVVRPLTAAERATVTICGEDGVSCVDGVVRVCVARGQPASLVAACVWNCAPGLVVDPGDAMDSDGVAAILCRRAHAERR